MHVLFVHQNYPAQFGHIARHLIRSRGWPCSFVLYFTVPFVLSWSLMDALACGCTVLASDTAPVREMIDDGQNGLLRGFYDVEGMADRAVEVLRDPAAYRHLGREAAERIRWAYAIEVTLPRLTDLFERAARGISSASRVV